MLDGKKYIIVIIMENHVNHGSVNIPSKSINAYLKYMLHLSLFCCCCCWQNIKTKKKKKRWNKYMRIKKCQSKSLVSPHNFNPDCELK